MRQILVFVLCVCGVYDWIYDCACQHGTCVQAHLHMPRCMCEGHRKIYGVSSFFPLCGSQEANSVIKLSGNHLSSHKLIFIYLYHLCLYLGQIIEKLYKMNGIKFRTEQEDGIWCWKCCVPLKFMFKFNPKCNNFIKYSFKGSLCSLGM